MSDYTIKNLKDVDDVAAGRAPGVEARMARSAIETKEIGVSYFRYDANTRAPYGHHHEVQEEVYVVTNGSGTLKLDDDVVEVKQWDVIRVGPRVMRGFQGGPEGLEIVAIGGTRPDEGDGNIVPGWWND